LKKGDGRSMCVSESTVKTNHCLKDILDKCCKTNPEMTKDCKLLLVQNIFYCLP